jgi:DNA-binding MarR family transcriptional regulator
MTSEAGVRLRSTDPTRTLADALAALPPGCEEALRVWVLHGDSSRFDRGDARAVKKVVDTARNTPAPLEPWLLYATVDATRSLGLNLSEVQTLLLVWMSGPPGPTAGAIASATGLSSGSVTGVLDQLEGQGWVIRVRDERDRRRVRVAPTPGAIDRIEVAMLDAQERARLRSLSATAIRAGVLT